MHKDAQHKLSLEDLEHLKDQMEKIEKKRGFLYPIEKQRLSSIMKLLFIEESKMNDRSARGYADGKDLNVSQRMLKKQEPLYQRLQKNFEKCTFFIRNGN